MISNTVSFVQPTASSIGRQVLSTANSQINPSLLTSRSGGGSNDVDSFQSMRKTAAVKPQFSGASDRQKKLMKGHINQGIALIRNGKYEEAIDHFQSPKQLGAMGVNVGHPVLECSYEPPTSVEEAKRSIRWAARKNMAFNDNANLSIKFARILFMDRETCDSLKLEPGTSEAEILDYINYEQALMAAEENIHTYQNMDGGKNVTYHPAAGQETDDDHEIDIATTLEKFNLPLTNDFLKRYKGRAKHIQKAEAIDLVQDATGKARVVKVPVNKNAD